MHAFRLGRTGVDQPLCFDEKVQAVEVGLPRNRCHPVYVGQTGSVLEDIRRGDPQATAMRRREREALEPLYGRRVCRSNDALHRKLRVHLDPPTATRSGPSLGGGGAAATLVS